MENQDFFSLAELISLNGEGLIPGPGESETAFKTRVDSVKARFQQQQNQLPSYEWQWASEQLKELFDFSPRWCTAYFSSHKLAPWQAAATWIDQNRVTSIQLNSSRFLKKLIDHKEILAHEATHAARAAFDELGFEEVFAYLTSGKKWRRVLGPLFRSPGEALVLLITALLGSLSQMAELFWDLSFLSTFFYLVVFILLFTWSIRLFRTRLQLQRASKNAIPLLRDPKKVRAFLFRLTDEELKALARGTSLPEKDDLRRKLLKAAYLNMHIHK
jgi:hypothetical protein